MTETELMIENTQLKMNNIELQSAIMKVEYERLAAALAVLKEPLKYDNDGFRGDVP